MPHLEPLIYTDLPSLKYILGQQRGSRWGQEVNVPHLEPLIYTDLPTLMYRLG